MMQVKYRIWLEQNGKVFGPGPYKLLEGIREMGNLSEAAKSMGMSYNKAYNLIKNIEERLGYRLITSKSGGASGGGSQLTDEAEILLNMYNKFFSECSESIESIFHKYFDEADLTR